jgi:hypothetical protein
MFPMKKTNVYTLNHFLKTFPQWNPYNLCNLRFLTGCTNENTGKFFRIIILKE